MLGIEVDLALVISWPGNASRRVVRSISFATGIFEDRSEQPIVRVAAPGPPVTLARASFGFHVRGPLPRNQVAHERSKIGGG